MTMPPMSGALWGPRGRLLPGRADGAQTHGDRLWSGQQAAAATTAAPVPHFALRQVLPLVETSPEPGERLSARSLRANP